MILRVDGASLRHGSRTQNRDIESATQSSSDKQLAMFVEEMCTTKLPWENPCGGDYQPSSNRNSNANVSHSWKIKELNEFKTRISRIYKELRANTPAIKHIDANNTWSIHKRRYQFLPRVKANSKLRLRKWHRVAQIFIGAFDYMFRAQLYYDMKKYNEVGNITNTLNHFRNEARAVLCEIESTINSTSTHHHHRSLRLIRPHRMRKILNFLTEARHFQGASCTAAVQYAEQNPPVVNEIDLRFLKFRFLSFLRSMKKVSKRKIVDRTSISSASSASNSNSNRSSSSRSLWKFESSNTESLDSTLRHFDSNLSLDPIE